MSELLRHFSDFDDLMELGVEAHLSGSGLDIRQGDRTIGRIDNPFSDSEVEPAKYIVLLCFTGHVGERQTSSIKLRGAERGSLGYIFPLSALQTLDSVEEGWARKYAWVAVNALLSGSLLSAAIAAPSGEVLRSETVSLDNVFLSYVSVAVLGRQNLAGHVIPEDTVPLMLMAQGVRFPSAPTAYASRSPLKQWAPSIGCSALGSAALEDVAALTTFIRLADEFDSAVGVFLTLYQVVEHWIGKLFGAALSGSYLDDPDPWTLKNRLARVSGERWRLAKLDGLALEAADRARLNDLGRDCREFLDAVGKASNNDDPWWKSLYALRNVIVHDQARFVLDGFHNLESVNLSLRDACLELLSCFKSPEPSSFWLQDEESDREED